MASRALELVKSSGEVVLTAVDKGITTRWDSACRAAASTSGTRDERIAQLKRAFSRELGTVGAAAGAIAAAPGPGTGAAIAADLSWFTIRSADLILAIAAVHGHTEPTVEERRAWVLAVLAFGDSAASSLTKLAGETGKGLGKRATATIPTASLQAINRKMGRTIVTKYGTKRGVLALGKALPVFIGSAVGGGANYVLTRSLAHHADSFFAHLPPALVVQGRS